MLIYSLTVIIHPQQPINYIKKAFHLKPSQDISDDATSVETFAFKEKDYKLYILEKDPSTKIIIVDFPGGAFISCSNTLKPYLFIDQPNTVVSIEYPVLPYGKMKITMEYLKAVLDYLNVKYDNPQYIFMGASAGCFYAMKLINLNKYNIIKYISMSGYYGYKTIDNPIALIGDRIYLRNLNSSTYNDCAPPPANVQTLFVVGSEDFLKDSTINYLQSYGNTDNMIVYHNGDHCFYLRYNSEPAQDFYRDVSKFIKN